MTDGIFTIKYYTVLTLTFSKKVKKNRTKTNVFLSIFPLHFQKKMAQTKYTGPAHQTLSYPSFKSRTN